MPSEKQPDWREKWLNCFPFDDISKFESFIEQLLKEERECIIALGEGMEKPICRCMCEKNKIAISYNTALSDFITKIKG